MQKFPIGPRPGRDHRLIKPRGRILDLTACVVATVGLAIGFEAAPLVQVKQGPAEMGQRQFLVQPFGPQRIGIKLFKRLGLGRVGRHQPGPGEAFHQRGLAAQIPVATPALRPCRTAIYRQGCL